MNIIRCLFGKYCVSVWMMRMCSGWVFLFPTVRHSPLHPAFCTVINPTPPCSIRHRSTLPPTLTKKKKKKKRKLFHLLNPFIHGLQVISPYSRHNPGPSGWERETESENEEKRTIYRQKQTREGRRTEREVWRQTAILVSQRSKKKTLTRSLLQRPYCGWVGGGGQTCQRLLTHVSRLPLGRLLEDWKRFSTKDLWLPGKKRKCVIDK